MKRFPAFFLCLLALSASASAGAVRLRTAASVDPGVPITLGDISSLEGADAEALKGLTILADPATKSAGRAWVIVTVADVKRALEASNARMSALTLGGSGCTVRFGAPPKPATEKADAAPAAHQPEPVDLAGPPTVRKHAAESLAALIGVEPTDLRLLFDSSDADFLDQPRFGVRVIVQPETSPGSGRAVLACRILDGDRLLESRAIRADAEARRRAVVVQQLVKRKDEVLASALAEQEMWLPASSGRPIASIDEIKGALARTRLEPGAVLRAEHLETPVIVRRNELVSIHALRGGFEVQTRARARADARRGEIIAFRPEGSKKEFTARVEGPGLAVIDLDGDPAEHEEE